MTAVEFQTLCRAAEDPWVFLTEHVRTQDPARGVCAFPGYEYLRELVSAVECERFLLVPKSRQMLVTWTMVAYFVWRLLFRGGGLYVFLSRNERCAEELIQRARFVLGHLPVFMRPRLSTNSREELAVAGVGSRLLSLPATPNGPRMYSPSAVFWDEMAFTPFDEPIWTALKPALDSGGTFVGVSSSGGAANLFTRFVLAEQEQSALPCGTTESETSSFILPPSSLFQVHRIHYTQHPEKQSAEWKHMAGMGLSETRWRQEQEISFEATSDLVYREFDPQRHILSADWPVNPAWEIYRAIDFGYRHPFVLWLQRTEDGEFIVFDEWAGRDRTTEEMLLAIRNIDYTYGLNENAVTWTACDPAGAAAQDSGLSPVDILRRAELKIKYRNSRVAPGIECVKAMLGDAAGRTRLRIAPRCRNLIADIGRYRWAATGDEPVKDGLCDHSLDALRYFFVNFDSPGEELPFYPRIASGR